MAKKRRPVVFLSDAPRRALSIPDRTIQLVGTNGSPIFERDPSVLIAFKDGKYRPPANELGKRITKFLREQPDYGDKLGAINENGKIVSITEFREPTAAEIAAEAAKRKSMEERLAEAEAKAAAYERELQELRQSDPEEELEAA